MMRDGGNIPYGSGPVPQFTSSERDESPAAMSPGSLASRDETAPEPLVATCDREERFISVSRAYAARFNRDPAEFRGRTIRETLGPEIYGRLQPFIAQVLEGTAVTFELDLF